MPQVSDSDSDDELVVRIAGGDREALTTLFRRRHLEVYRFALHMSGKTTVAEDVVQEVFLALISDAARYEAGRSGVKAWLCGIARNHARRHLDAERRVTVLGDGDEAERALPLASGDVLGDLTRAERVEALRRAVISLPVRYREVVVLCDLQEMSYAEAADSLGCAVGTVRSRLHRGRALLASKMAATEPRDERTGDRIARCIA
jgi:RNA polymerase sigma-70 factor (ECF subfamily)